MSRTEMIKIDFRLRPAITTTKKMPPLAGASIDLTKCKKVSKAGPFYADQWKGHQKGTVSDFGLPPSPSSACRGSNSLNASQAFMALSSAMFLSIHFSSQVGCFFS